MHRLEIVVRGALDPRRLERVKALAGRVQVEPVGEGDYLVLRAVDELNGGAAEARGTRAELR